MYVVIYRLKRSSRGWVPHPLLYSEKSAAEARAAGLTKNGYVATFGWIELP